LSQQFYYMLKVYIKIIFYVIFLWNLFIKSRNVEHVMLKFWILIFLVKYVRNYVSFCGFSCSVSDGSCLFWFIFLFGPGQQSPEKQKHKVDPPPTKTVKKSRKENVTSNTLKKNRNCKTQLAASRTLPSCFLKL
jgi:hypothetical protein